MKCETESACGKDMLEELRDRLGCMYLSDLRLSPWRGEAIRVLAWIDLGPYPLSVWNDAVAYLLGTADSFTDVRLAKERFQLEATKLKRQ